MNKTKYTMTVLTALLFIAVCATAGQASAQRTFVAGPGIGSDTNTASDCSFSAPCRNFSAAYTVTNTGGEIIALSAGAGYGGLTITHAITVTGLPGQVAFVAVSTGTTGFTVAAGASDLVVIRDIHFNGAGFSSNTGLSHTGGKLIVKHCVFESLTTGVSAAGTNNTTLPARMDLIDSDFYNNGTAVLSTGSGANSPGNSVVASTTVIRINGGNITGNGTGLNMVNQGSGLFNILLFGPGNVPFTNVVGNTTNLGCSPAACNANEPVFSYNSLPFGP